MTERTAFILFSLVWGMLLLIAVVAQLLFEGQPKRSAGIFTNLLVSIPFAIVFGVASLGRDFGTYGSAEELHDAGAVITFAGLIVYICSLIFLRRSWSISASIREGHHLVTRGPYRFVRHPMYSAMTLIFLGSGLLLSNYILILFTPLVGYIYWFRAKKEEELLSQEFSEYTQYSRRTRMFVPWLL